MGVELTRVQLSAIKKVKEWYENNDKQIFIIHGYAGTGKSTIIEAMIDELNIRNNTRFCTFTGKASLVLNQKGCPATTLHRLMYDLVEYFEDGKTKYKFEKKSELPNDIKLIVVDEVSMVSKALMDDLLSYNKPVIAIGDPMQLPPIGEDNGFMSQCDVFLSEIHRQAQGNPIIHLSMLARTGQQIPYGTYGKSVVVVPRKNVTKDIYLRADQIICGKNNTRKDINTQVRQQLGFYDELPVMGDKIICLRNNWKEILDGYPLINGMVGSVNSIKSIDVGSKTCYVDFKPEFLESQFKDLVMDLREFMGEKVSYDSSNSFLGKFTKSNTFDYGYAITCHKSQGSSFRKVLLFEEVLKPENHKKWLYTGITRAEEKLILVR